LHRISRRETPSNAGYKFLAWNAERTEPRRFPTSWDHEQDSRRSDP
jgi:hypothetical protein